MHAAVETPPPSIEKEKTQGSLSAINSHSSIGNIQQHHYTVVDNHHKDKDNVNHHVVDNIPTPLPPNFTAIPHTTPESARWIAMISAAIMVFLVVAVIVLAVVF
jgi:hypothetical protein